MEGSVSFKSYHCLVCGAGSTVILDDDGNKVRVKEEDEGAESFDGRQELNPSESECVIGANFSWEIQLFQFFTNHFNMKSNCNDKTKFVWKPNEPVPLCEACMVPLRVLKSLQEELKQLETQLLEKMKISEEKFKEMDLYNSDERLFWCRLRALGPQLVGRSSEVLTSKVQKKKAAVEKRRTLIASSTRSLRKIPKLEETEAQTDSEAFDDEPRMELVEEDQAAGSFDDDPLLSPDTPSSPSQEDPGDSCDAVSSRNLKVPTIETPLKSEADPNTSATKETEPGRRPKRAAASKTKVYLDDFNLDPEIMTELGPVMPPPKKGKKVKEQKQGELKKTVKKTRDEDYNFDSGFIKSAKDPYSRRYRKAHCSNQNYRVSFDEDVGKHRYLTTYFEKVSGSKDIFECSDCKASFQSGGGHSTLKMHVLRDHLTNNCPWPYCEYVGRTKYLTEDHFMMFHDKKESLRYACDICGMPHRGNENLRIHRASHMNAEERAEAEKKGELPNHMGRSQCQICGANLAKNYIKKHIELCSKKKEDEQNPKAVKDDAESGTGSETFLCPDCGRSYKNATALKVHTKRSHPDLEKWGTMRFVCIYCDKRFFSEEKLKIHKVKHTGDYPFPCSLCKRKFATKKNYEQHMRLHTNERPFQCDFCPMAYVSESSFKRHIRIYHEEGSQPKRASFYKDPSRGRFKALKCTVVTQETVEKEGALQ